MLDDQQQLDNNTKNTTTTTTTTASRRSRRSNSNSGAVGDEVMMIYDDTTTTNLPTSLDGILAGMHIEQQYMPTTPTDLKKGEPGASKVRVLIKADDNYDKLYDYISKKMRKSLPFISDCACFDPMWICTMGKYRRRKPGEVHRDTAETTGGHLTVLIFLDDCDSGGVKFWQNSPDFMPGEQFDCYNKPKNYIRQLKKQHENESIIILPQKYMAIIFDVRLMHQSRAHRGDEQRNVLSFSITCNGCKKLF